MQAKLAVKTEEDPLEREADLAADRVMRNPTAVTPARQTHVTPPPSLQRKCECGGSCPKCRSESEEERKRLQKKSSHAAHTKKAAAPPIVHEVLRSSSQPLDARTREFFEPRFGHDFSRVRVSADAHAAKSAHSVGALAYTVGDRIVFGSGQYAPGTDSGKRLIAHELAHVIQQGTGCQPLLQRKVSSDFGTIRKLLSYSFLDWAITDAEAHSVLLILNPLSREDLKDTVAEMEKHGLVDRLFDNVSDDDQQTQTGLLERINDVRVHKGKKGQSDTVGSCDIDHRKQIDDRVQGARDWARKSKDQVNDFASNPAAHADIGKLLNLHFFHPAHNRPRQPADDVKDAKTIANNFEKTEQLQNAFPRECSSKFDPECSFAAAYVDYTKKRVGFCLGYFENTAQRQTYLLLHEFMHMCAYVSDRGYGDERVFAYLSAPDAINNADSYALFALDLTRSKDPKSQDEGSQDVRFWATPQDAISDCDDAQKKEIQRSFAFGARMIVNAISAIIDPRANPAQTDAHFKTHDRVKLKRFIERLEKINELFKSKINFECEQKCKTPAATGYWRHWGWTVHICPAWFNLPEDQREDDILLVAVAEELGIGYGPRPGTPAYASLTEDKAYESAMTYMGYAREVTDKGYKPTK